MRALRLTEREYVWVTAWLRAGVDDDENAGEEAEAKVGRRVLDKLARLTEPGTAVAVAPIEEALVTASGGKVIPLLTGHARASRQAGQMGATPEQALVVGGWLASQGWMSGPLTILDVLNKWPGWLTKATASQPPPGLPAGLGGTIAVGPGVTQTGGGPARRGPSSGFR